LGLLKTLTKRSSSSLPTSELIVVDSQADQSFGSSLKKKFPDIHYIPFQANEGYAKIVNTGIRSAHGTYLLILNADIHIEPKEIGKILSFVQAHPSIAAVGVTDAFRFPTLPSILARRTFIKRTPWGKRALANYEMKAYTRKEPKTVDWVRGDCWLIPRRALSTVGLLDERFFMYFEDTDWCRQANHKNLEVYFLSGIKTTQHQQGSSRQQGIKGLQYRFLHSLFLLHFLLHFSLSAAFLSEEISRQSLLELPCV
jgi:GT2 family glycosyltransferase